ncbi:uncharacterized protein LOC108934910 isoform X1 [Scleropages formosus]|uniref:Zgc:110366 n=1 Tax=Scleropages formosus TaxID=113540 RepID=A0A8C9V6X6_SCLFO|nr:uncharacterized protein LOC108934910 isoform X1 [Scleropages formosus]
MNLNVRPLLSCPTVRLSNGLHIPILGLGTSHHGGYSHRAVVYALRDCGLRHVDTAKRYGCEEQLGVSVKESGVPRHDLWLTSKLWPGDYGYSNAKRACADSCRRLGVDYLDLYLMHWPDCSITGRTNREVRAETWEALEELYDEGVCRAIGVSNFQIAHLQELKEDCRIVPHVNQVEFHPFQQPWALMEYCHQEGIVFEGYCPLAKGEALSHPVVHQLADKYNRTPAQICIRWSIQNGVVTIPKSTKEEKILENCQVFGFSLDEEDMDYIQSLHCHKKLIHLTYPLWNG